LAGAGLAWRRDIVFWTSIKSLISFAGLIALLISVVFFTPEIHFPGWAALLPVFGAVALIAGGPDAAVNRIVLSNRVAVFIGLISYPLYLWHWPLISYAYIIRAGRPPTLLMAGLLVAASFLFAWITYLFVEYPIRFGSHRGRTQIATVSVAFLGACGLAVWIDGGVSERFPADLDIQKINAAKLDVTYGPTKGMEVMKYNTCSGGDTCKLGVRKEYALISHIGSGDRKVALAGDSVLFHYGPRAQQLADEGRLAANTYFVTGPYCAPVPGITQQGEFVDCSNVPSSLVDLVKREKVQSVVLGAAWTGYQSKDALINRNGQTFPLSSVKGQGAFYANLEDYVRLLQGLGAEIYLIRGVPGSRPRFDPTKMVTRSVTG
jgi:hypothetical protein